MAEITTPPTQRASAVGWVYFIRAGEHIKIGWSPDPRKRLKALAVGNAHSMELLAKFPGTVKDEKHLHRLFRPYKSRTDGEWFHARKPILALVDWARRYEASASDARAMDAEKEARRVNEVAAQRDQRAREWQAAAEEARSLLAKERAERTRLFTVAERAMDYAWKGHDATAKAVNELEGEVRRAIDATDDHEGLTDAVRVAMAAFMRAVEPALDTTFQAAGGTCMYLGLDKPSQ